MTKLFAHSFILRSAMIRILLRNMTGRYKYEDMLEVKQISVETILSSCYL